MPRRRYDQFCSIARALDAVGERWTLLIVRELLAGPRRYTDLHADLPGISTDILASRLKDMEREALVTRRRLPSPGTTFVYELTPRGRGLLPVLTALADWGAPDLAEHRSTDAVRAHWFAIPLMDRLASAVEPSTGVVNVQLDEGTFHIAIGRAAGNTYADGPAQDADAHLALDFRTCLELAGGQVSIGQAVTEGRAQVNGGTPLARALLQSAAERELPQVS